MITTTTNGTPLCYSCMNYKNEYDKCLLFNNIRYELTSCAQYRKNVSIVKTANSYKGAKQ